MSMRYLGGFITASYNPLKVPNAPTIGTATAGSTSASVTFTAPSNVGGGAITSYIAAATKTSDGTVVTATGTSSPITITGLTDGVAYTVQVAAVNTYGPSAYSAPSGSVTPVSSKLYGWGRNNIGQLGLNDKIYRSSPVQVGALTTWSRAASLGGCSIVTKFDGTLWSWGQNNYGQLGQNDTVNRSSPVQIGALTTWSKIAGGKTSAIATKTDGTLWTWGNNFTGQLGQNISYLTNMSSPVQVGALTTWLQIAGGNYHTIATKTDGTLWTWGQNADGQLGQNISTSIKRSSPVQVGALTTWLQISGGNYHTIATKTDGTLWAWGRNDMGQLGQNNLIYCSSPVQVGALTTWLQIAGGDRLTVAIKTDGTLWAWGRNDRGQLGQNNVIYRSSPVQIGALTNWSQVSSGSGNLSVFSIKTDGSLWVWGYNIDGQLGLGDVASRSSPVQVGALTSWLNVSAGSNFTMATSSS